MIAQSQPKKIQRTYASDSILESLRGMGSNVGKTISNDIVSAIPKHILSSLTGSPPQASEMQPNHPVEMLSSEITERPAMRQEFMRPGGLRPEETGLKQKIEAVRMELAALSKSMQSLSQEIHKAVMEIPVAPGIYHLNFFERLRSMLKLMRKNIDDSRTWLALSTQRKKKQCYWGMYKKHGTNFGLSNERTVSTSAG